MCHLGVCFDGMFCEMLEGRTGPLEGQFVVSSQYVSSVSLLFVGAWTVDWRRFRVVSICQIPLENMFHTEIP
jgi:hypothetical protein